MAAKSTKAPAEEEVEYSFEIFSWVTDFSPLIELTDGSDAELRALNAWAVENEYNVVYALGNQVVKNTTKVGTKTETVEETEARIWRFTRNLTGYAIAPASKNVALPNFGSAAMYTLPKIPWGIIQEIDTFFRYVDQKRHTEAVIVFTYDDTYLGSENPSEGWGFLVPDQWNTSGSCNYDASTVIDELPDDYEHINIVGTAHSHPGMGAFCSGTDKGDQETFDGIHITFGWKGKSTKTDFHVELQMDDSSFRFKPEDVLEDVPEIEVDERFKDWAEKVQVRPTGTVHRSPGSGPSGAHVYGNKKLDVDHLPSLMAKPDAYNCIVADVPLTASELYECPVCRTKSIIQLKDNGKCTTCMSYVITRDFLDVKEFVGFRGERKLQTSELESDKKPYKHVWLWKINNEGEQTIMLRARGSCDMRHPPEWMDEMLEIPSGSVAGVMPGKDEGTDLDLSDHTRISPFFSGHDEDDIFEPTHCGNCGEPLVDDEEECPLCLVLVGYDAYAAANADALGRAAEHRAKDDYKSTMLCCGEHFFECDCDTPLSISFEEADSFVALDLNPGDEVYDRGSGCDSCVFQFMPQCPSYLEFLRAYLLAEMETRELQHEPIEVCDKYVNELTGARELTG